jgi:hypothetical protein
MKSLFSATPREHKEVDLMRTREDAEEDDSLFPQERGHCANTLFRATFATFDAGGPTRAIRRSILTPSFRPISEHDYRWRSLRQCGMIAPFIPTESARLPLNEKGRSMMKSSLWLAPLALTLASAASAATFTFNGGSPDGKIATASGGGVETADDFLTTDPTTLTGGSFTGLIAGGTATTSSITGVKIEIYRVFPLDSTVPPSAAVPTRANSPSDVDFQAADSALSQLSFSTNVLSGAFTAANSVTAGGIHPLPNTLSGGNGPITGTEVQFDFTLATPIDLATDHYFFVPVVELSNGGSFYWLSAPKPNSVNPFSPDLQSWIRDDNLSPDWLRVGTDVVGGGSAFNAAFSLNGLISDAVPEAPAWEAMILGFGLIGGVMRRRPTLAKFRPARS